MSNVCANELTYGAKERQSQNKTYRIETNDALGRFVVATGNIGPGEVIMQSLPLVLGPKMVSPALCLGCHRKLNLETVRYECASCRWPLCSKECETSPLHEPECQLFAQSHYKPFVKNDDSKQSVYCSITPLRALLLKKQQPEQFQLLLNCQSHLDKHLSTPIYQVLRHNLVPLFTQVFNLDTDETEILTICSIFDTNCFDVRASGFVSVRGLYPSISFLSHDCKPNTKHSFNGADFNLVLRATVPIKAGDLITATYTQTLWNTVCRRGHLKMSKQFDCCCQRCQDPTELGTFLGSTDCTDCGGRFLNLDPSDLDSDWSCSGCGLVLTSEEILWGNEVLKREVLELDKSDPRHLEEFLERYEGVLHGKNSFCLQVKYALSQMYGLKLNELSDALILRQIQLCQELLSVAHVLEPGFTRFRGLLLYDLYKACMVRISRGEKNLENDAEEYLKEASLILKTEPDFKELNV